MPWGIQFSLAYSYINILYCAQSLSHVWLCGAVDYSLPGSSVHGIIQATILEWVVISFSRGSFWPRDQTQVSCTTGGFFTIWATREAVLENSSLTKSWWFHADSKGTQPYIYMYMKAVSIVQDPGEMKGHPHLTRCTSVMAGAFTPRTNMGTSYAN